ARLPGPGGPYVAEAAAGALPAAVGPVDEGRDVVEGKTAPAGREDVKTEVSVCSITRVMETGVRRWSYEAGAVAGSARSAPPPRSLGGRTSGWRRPRRRPSGCPPTFG